MARQRMVSDDFWVDPDLVDLTTEQRTCLLLFLTCKESNVIGIYRVIWRVVGSGMGWTHDQILNAARDLKRKNCVDIHEDSGWVWVKEWWKHNSLRGAFTGNVAKKAAQELTQVPDFWRVDVRNWLTENDSEGACKPLLSPLQGAAGNPNPTTSITPIPTTTNHLVVVEDLEDLIEAGIWAEGLTSSIRNEAGLRRKIRTRLMAEGPNAEDLHALRAWCAQRDRTANERVQHEREIASTAARQEQRAAQAAEVSAYLQSLDEASHAALVEEFVTHLATVNGQAYQFYRRQGLKSKIVETAFLGFIASNYLSRNILEVAA